MIRKAKATDMENITDIWYQVNVQTHDFISQKYWLKQLPMVKEGLSSTEIYVYEEDNKILGFIGLEDQYIAGVFVDLEGQSSGIGHKLLSYVKHLKDQLKLKVYQKNKRAISFYEREGFTIKSESLDEVNHEYEYVMEFSKY